jgi:hypothetical protein
MVMRVWQGTTADGYALLVERDENACWIVTVASVSRSRNTSLETALLEAGGSSVSRSWAARLAAAISARRVADIVSERPPHSSRTGPA